MKKILLVALCTLLVAACGKNKTPAAKSKTGLPKASAQAKAAPAGADARVAYIEIDSLATQYQYCIDQQQALEEKHNAYQQKLSAESKTVQNAMADYQKKVQNGTIHDEATAKSAQTAIQRQQQTLESHQSQYEEAFARATADYQKSLRQRLDDFLKEYNKDGRYALILSSSQQTMNVLYAVPGLDITKEVIDGLNAAYKK